ncbi:PREDICTED: uncharacterized protein LOC109216405 [Nicotiana attenuata]|uniref:uncharacterized protein LOC109216405 n=1 Tax=Nicotiana attenuata TaxID=49451 RepID=UPI000905557E|nr:PREDICTED: uncharacterized protein LOC109216405 [Nicotiana attenuata]
MENCNPVSTPVECGVKVFKHGEGEKINPTLFMILVGSLRYLTCTRQDILFGVGLVSRFMEEPTTSHLKVAKRILRYIKSTLDYGIFYSFSKDSKPVGYCGSDWASDIDDRKSTTGHRFYDFSLKSPFRTCDPDSASAGSRCGSPPASASSLSSHVAASAAHICFCESVRSPSRRCGYDNNR